jgi:hypothetical protein
MLLLLLIIIIVVIIKSHRGMHAHVDTRHASVQGD